VKNNIITQTLFGEGYKLWRSSLCNFPHHHVTTSLLGQNILLSTLFSDALSLCSSEPYKPADEIIVLFFFNVGDGNTEDSKVNGSNHSLNVMCS
jgi:hypothetical protein